MIDTPFVYTDMFTGKDVRVRERGNGFASKIEEFWAKGGYRIASKLELKAGLCCGSCKNNFKVNKCTVVGDDGAAGTNVDRKAVCNFFKETLT